MKRTLACLALSFVVATGIYSLPGLAELPLRPVNLEEENPAGCRDRLGYDDRLWGQPDRPGDQRALSAAIDRSLRYLKTPAAAAAYRHYPIPGISRDRVQRSLQRFRKLLLTSSSPQELQTAVCQEFIFYQAIGQDNQGTVAFTGYFEPTYRASRIQTPQYRYPLFRQPANLNQWQHPHPTRIQLEGIDGLQTTQGPLKGLEIVWLRDRLEAFLIQVQGSARLQLIDGTTMTVGYAGGTNYPYTSIGRELIQDNQIRPEDLTLPVLIQYFQDRPDELNRYLPRNNRFIFFRETGGAPATGSLGLPVTAERSIATDKSLMPPGALALIQTLIPYPTATQQLQLRPASQYVLDQDTGSAIKGPGRVDIFMGTGTQAGDRAGLINHPGQFYYLLLRK